MAAIHAIQVKEYVQALVDEGQVRVEKIGSGNWYWSFGSEKKRERQRQKEELEKEAQRLKRGCEEVEKTLDEEKRKRARGAFDIKDGQKQETEQEEEEAEEEEARRLMQSKAKLEKEVVQMRAEEQAGTTGGIKQKKRQIADWKETARQWTDNIYILEEHLLRMAGGDREALDGLKRECYGAEYIEGEGLRELESDE